MGKAIQATQKTGNLSFFALAWVILALPAFGADLGFVAEVDRNQISLDDSVALKMTVTLDGNARGVTPRFSSPDFEVVNEYNSTYIESYYDGNSGKFGMKSHQTMTKVLKPLKIGSLKISGIEVDVSGQKLRADDIVIQVGASGAGTAPPKSYGGSGLGLRGSTKTARGPQIFIRAELSKDSVFKGEQVLVSYYLYRRARIFNLDVQTFPSLNGFLKDDTEIPAKNVRLETDRVVLDGVPYERSLLLRYAAYPLQEGKLKVDPLVVKYSYYGGSRSQGLGQGLGDDEDPFMGLFQNMTAQTAVARSEVVPVNVSPLPTEGKPPSFTGGVGDFNIVSAIDKTQIHANEAVTLTVKVDGRGNLAAIGEPKAKWPEGVELYDSKGKATTGKGGLGEKVFEFLLIPRQPGKVQLPALEFSFFDPVKKAYVVKNTNSVDIQVLEPLPGTAFVPTTPTVANKTSGSAPKPQVQEDLRYLKSPDTENHFEVSGRPIWRWLYWICLLLATYLGGLISWDLFKRSRSSKKVLSSSEHLSHLKELALRAEKGDLPWLEVSSAYEALSGVIFDALDRNFQIGARSHPRSELETILVGERGLDVNLWKKIAQLLEFAELVRFATQAGAVSEKTAKSDLATWVKEAESITHSLRSNFLVKS